MNIRMMLKLLGIMSLFASTTSYGFNFEPQIRFSGFANAGASVTSASNVDFYDPLFKQKISGVPAIVAIGNSPTFNSDTLGGLQFIFSLNDHLSFTAQLLSEGVNDYAVVTDWLYLDWRINDTWDIKVGRMIDPVFMFSQDRKINYAYLWSRLPLEFYNLPTFDFEGITLRYSAQFNNGWRTDNLFGFGMSADFDHFSPIPLFVDTYKGFFVELTASNDYWHLRGTYHRANTDLTLGQFEIYKNAMENPCAAFAQLSPSLITLEPGPVAGTCQIAAIDSPFPFSPSTQGLVTPNSEVAKLLVGKNLETEIYAVGYEFNWNHIVSMAEWGKVFISDNYYLSSNRWYVTLGYNWDNITPHVTYSNYKTLNTARHRLFNTPGANYVNPYSYFGPLPIPTPETFEESINDFLKLTSLAQSSIDVGIRYDVGFSTSLKFDYRYVMPENNSAGFFNLPPGKRVSWITALVAVIF